MNGRIGYTRVHFKTVVRKMLDKGSLGAQPNGPFYKWAVPDYGAVLLLSASIHYIGRYENDDTAIS